MGRVRVRAPGGEYPVLVGSGALQEVGPLLRELGVTRAAVVTDDRVGPLWADALVMGMAGQGVAAEVLAVPAGEHSKSFDRLRQVLGFLERAQVDRSSVVVALGGGVVGDLAGFAAAVWLRGVRLLHVPTSLLAMVDSAIGGKTGIDTELTKNGVGAFWQPVAVAADLATLSTLPEAEFVAAFAEVIKYAVSMDAALFHELAAGRERLLARDVAALEPVVERCVGLKAGVVAADERERGPREILNYGHTVGHAVEAASGYTASHGRAVALGMRAAARIAARAGLCDDGLVAAQDALLSGYGLPGDLPTVSPAAVLEAIARDKKARSGAVRWVMPRKLGRAEVGKRVPEDLVREVVMELLVG